MAFLFVYSTDKNIDTLRKKAYFCLNNPMIERL